MKMRKLLIFVFIIVMLAGIASAPLPSIGSEVHEFYGAITGAPASTTITATIGGATAGTVVTTVADSYGCVDCIGEGVPAFRMVGTTGNTITFSASGGTISPTTYTFAGNNKTKLDFTYTATTTTTSSGGGGGGGGAGAGGAAAATVTEITDTTIISEITATLPAGWANVQVQQEGTPTTTTVTLTSAIIDSAIAAATSSEAKALLESIKAAVAAGELQEVSAKVTLTNYKVNNKDTGESIYRTKITIVIEAAKDMENVKIVEVIPKDVAADVSELTFVPQPTILQKDPIVEWTITKLLKGETKELAYYVDKKVTSIADKTLAVGKAVVAAAPGEKAPEGAKEGAPEEAKKEAAKFPTGIAIVIAIVVIGLIIFFAVRKKKE